MCSIHEGRVVLFGEVCMIQYMQYMCDMACRFVPCMCTVYVWYGVYV